MTRRPAGRVQIVAIRSSKTRRPSFSAGPCSRSSSYSACSRKSSSASFSSALPTLQAQPDDGPANALRRPVDRADHPRPANGRELLGGGRVEQEGRVGMLLQEAGGDGVGHLAFDGLLHDRRLVLAERHDDDLAGFEDRADAHRQRLVRHVLLAEEAAGGVAARHRIERDQARPAVARRARLVEADVPGAADAEDLQVDAARPANLLLVAGAVVLGLVGRDRAVGNVDVLRSEC